MIHDGVNCTSGSKESITLLRLRRGGITNLSGVEEILVSNSVSKTYEHVITTSAG
jgi:hypothetical protein